MNKNNCGDGDGKGKGFISQWWPWNRSRDSDQDLAPYRRLAIQLHYDLIRPDNPRSVLLVTPTASRACGYSSADLASCLAEELRRPVLLIDLCHKDREASRILNCTDNRGLTDMLCDPALPLDEVVLPTTCENVSFLPAGTSAAGSPPATADSINALLKEAQSRYEFVVLSGGSVLDNAAALSLAPHVGCVLLLAVENETKVEDLDTAQNALSMCKARKLGLVLTTLTRG